MKKILVTGGAGFIGSHAVVELFGSGYEPIILDNFSNSEKWIIDRIEKIVEKKIIVYEGDCTDANFLDCIFEKEKNIAGVIHFAGFKSVEESVQKPLKYYKNNINSTITLLETMKKHNVKNLVFSSSATVYGKPDKNPILETAPKKIAANIYGNTKSINEDILRDFIKAENNFSIIPLRYFNPIGAHPSGLIGEAPKGKPNNLVPFITQTAAKKRKKIIIFGDDYDTVDGSGVRDFIHVVDLAQAHIITLEYLMKQKSPFYDIFNVGTGKGTSVKKIIQTFEKVNNLKINYEVGPRRKGDIDEFFADPTKIKKTIGWQSKKSIEDALCDAWRWEQNYKKI